MRRITQLMCFAMVIGVVGQAQALLLTFDDVPGGSTQNSYADVGTYKGFNFSTNLDWIDTVGSSWNFGAVSGDFTLLNNNAGTGTILDAGGADFTFDGLWAKRWNTPTNSGGADNLFGTLSGWNNGVQVWSVNTGLNGSFKFFGAQAGLIDELRLGMGNFFLVDDISVNMQPVPEPSSLLMLTGLGLCFGAAGWRKRRKSA